MISSVLFVCTGNICRSPTAEGVLRSRLAAAGLDGRVAVDSAGTHGYHIDEPPDSRAIRMAARRGYDLQHQRARKIGPADYQGFDMILAMDRGHLSALRRLCPPAYEPRLRLFLDAAPAGAGCRGLDVPDPYYGGPQDFELMLDMIETGVEGLMAELLDRQR